MILLDALLSPLRDRRIKRLASELARRLEPQAELLVAPALRWMTFPESRGYIRAKLFGLAANHAEQMLSRDGRAGAELQRRLATLAIEILAQSIIADNIRQRAIRPSLRPAA
jgi:hypothetical protein